MMLIIQNDGFMITVCFYVQLDEDDSISMVR